MAPAALADLGLASGKEFDPIVVDQFKVANFTPEAFDPKKHLAFQPPHAVLTMSQIGLAEDTGVSPIAASQPFQLFTEDAVKQMRAEIFNDEVLKHHRFQSDIAAYQVRGYATKYGHFAYDAWNHPETLKVISAVAGVDLVPVMDYDIGHINFMTKSKEQVDRERSTIKDNAVDCGNGEHAKPIVGWHRDSYPLVCVLMLSDCTTMVGGETALVTPGGKIVTVRGPQMGSAAILQGRYITHLALRSLGARERITSVTSLRPKDPLMRDDTVLNTVRGISDVNELYFQFGEYRLEMMQERIRNRLKIMRQQRGTGRDFDTGAFKDFLKQQISFLSHMDSEMVMKEDIAFGYLPHEDIPDVKAGETETVALEELELKPLKLETL